MTDLSKIVSSSRPVDSVDVEKLVGKHGYAQIDECLNGDRRYGASFQRSGWPADQLKA